MEEPQSDRSGYTRVTDGYGSQWAQGSYRSVGIIQEAYMKGLKCEQATDHRAGTESEWENVEVRTDGYIEDYRSGCVEVAQKHQVKENYTETLWNCA